MLAVVAAAYPAVVVVERVDMAVVAQAVLAMMERLLQPILVAVAVALAVLGAQVVQAVQELSSLDTRLHKEKYKWHILQR